ncbi:MAG TPA: TNT domain-containing protein [Actinocrinis sp.]|uniref:TNT domain-containing protein n=1 Tax=Actinocrinis sp. TaxID=1920516 RepID=UPI002DDD6EA5|nr:TNT domain-containing protein [Actinocrinis sp.]HEV2346317.1 TNT domain-containing protein [Actinocrinis sp.]
MSNPIVKALEDAAQRVGRTLSTDAGKAVEDFYRSAGKNTEAVVERIGKADAENAHKLVDLAEKAGKGGAVQDAGKAAAMRQKFGDILDPANAGKPVRYLDANGKPIPTSKLVHPDLAEAEQLRLQSIQDKLGAESRAYKAQHGNWPDPPAGVDRGNPAVQGLLPPGYDPYHGQGRDAWMQSITKPDGSLDWADGNKYPDGFSSPTDREPVVLSPGQTIDRFGGPNGKFTSPAGVPYPDRALPASSLDGASYHQYEVIKPLPAWQGGIAPQMGEPGGGVQHYLPVSVEALIKGGYLREKPL